MEGMQIDLPCINPPKTKSGNKAVTGEFNK
jgi:hypothetical protein